MDRFLQFLNRGWALEMYLIGLKTLLALMLFPNWPISIRVFSDLQWFVPDIVLALPFASIAILQGYGIYLNAKGIESNWILRAAGALIAITVWGWILTKSILIGEATSLFPVSIMSLLASVYILWKATNRLPIPIQGSAKT